MTKQLTKATVDTAVWEVGVELRDDYSGRGMYGDSCWGVVGETDELQNFEAELAKAATLEEVGSTNDQNAEDVLETFMDKLAELRKYRREDSMGMSRIYYYPQIELVD